MSVQLDLHTHSIISYDGGINRSEYEALLADKSLVLAITDHNEIEFASHLQKDFPDQIIIGEEILTTDGEVIGLFLKEKIQKGLTAKEACEQIKAQEGLVYIPHPFEIRRKGLQISTLESIANLIDIVEVFNARAFKSNGAALAFAQKHNLVAASSSDAHSMSGIGSAFSKIDQKPEKHTLIPLLKAAALQKNRASISSFLAPTKNKLIKKFKS